MVTLLDTAKNINKYCKIFGNIELTHRMHNRTIQKHLANVEILYKKGVLSAFPVRYTPLEEELDFFIKNNGITKSEMLEIQKQKKEESNLKISKYCAIISTLYTIISTFMAVYISLDR